MLAVIGVVRGWSPSALFNKEIWSPTETPIWTARMDENVCTGKVYRVEQA